MDCLKRTWAEIDIDALLHNLAVIKEHTGGKIAAVIKANAYGHGAVFVATELERAGVDMFAVSNLEEAAELRDAKIKSPILLLGYTPTDAAGLLYENRVIQTVYSYEYAEELSRSASDLGILIECHLKLDTGMSRLGFDCRCRNESAIDEMYKACSLSGLNITGAFTHFATADEETLHTNEQYERFVFACNELKKRGIKLPTLHCCNSAGLMLHPDKHLSLSRPGIILYGLSPDNKTACSLPLRPVMSFKSTVSLVKKLRAGDAVSYGRHFIADKEMTVATVSVGYADGYPRALSGKGYMLVNGKPAPVLGSVCMDQTVIDVSDAGEVKTGDEVILFGNGLPVEEPATLCGTINYELLCGVSHRVPRVYIKNGKVLKTVDYVLKQF